VLGANFIPRERAGRLARIVWMPLVIAWIAYPFVAVASARLPAWLGPIRVSPVVSWSAVAVGAAALGGTWVCWKRMGKSWRMGIDPDERTALIVTGHAGDTGGRARRGDVGDCGDPHRAAQLGSAA
jgi:cation transporter-like permease